MNSQEFRIDVHTHILPRTLPDFSTRFGHSGFIRLQECPGCTDLDMVSDEGKFFRRIDSRCFDPEHRMRDLDLLGIEKQVLSTLPVMMSYWTPPHEGQIISEFLNDHLLECVQAFPQRYIGLGNLPMQDPDLAIREAQRIQKAGLVGVQIGSNIHGVNLSDPRFHPVWAALEALDMCVFVHPWNMMGEERMSRYWLPWLVGMPAESSLAICSLIFGGIFEKFPRLRFAFAHGGGSFPWNLGRISHGFESRPDLVAVDNPHPPTKYLGRFFVDSLVHDPKALRFLLDQMSEDCILLGSDYPFPLGENQPGKLVESLNLSQEFKQKIFYHNAIRFLFGERKPWTSN